MFRVFLVVVAVLVVGSVITPSEVVGQEGLSISGSVWFDQNSDGVRQPGEFGIIRRQVYLSGPGGMTRQTQTDRDGRYVFSGLAAGTYSVSMSDESLTIQTSPERRVRPPYTRTVELADSSAVNVDFGFGQAGPLTVFRGLAFINAAPADSPRVRALIDGLDCTGPSPVLPTDLDHATYSISVLPSALLEGCGEDGDLVNFTVNGLTANETATYGAPVGQQGPPLVSPPGQTQSQSGRSTLRLTVGQPFDVFWPRIEERDQAGEQVWGYGYTVAAMIDGQVCAIGLPRVWDSIMVIVPSETMKPGCGREGAIITFAVEGFATTETRVWSAKPAAEYEELVLDLVKSETATQAGSGFAYYWIDLPEMVPTHPLFDEVDQIVIATIDGEYCGQARGVGPRQVLVAVAPAELREGCGRPGAQVAFSQTDEPYATAPWQPGFHVGPAAPGIAQAGELAPTPSEVEMPSQEISPPSVGDGGLR